MVGRRGWTDEWKGGWTIGRRDGRGRGGLRGD